MRPMADIYSVLPTPWLGYQYPSRRAPGFPSPPSPCPLHWPRSGYLHRVLRLLSSRDWPGRTSLEMNSASCSNWHRVSLRTDDNAGGWDETCIFGSLRELSAHGTGAKARLLLSAGLRCALARLRNGEGRPPRSLRKRRNPSLTVANSS